MEQMKLSKSFARVHVPSRALCFQRTAQGRYVGTLSQTDRGYTGHVLAPKHAILPDGVGSGSMGFLHADLGVAHGMLALHVAKQAWDGRIEFDPTCLVDQEESVKDQFENWLIDMICRIRAHAMKSLSTEADARKAEAERMRPAVAEERRKARSARHGDHDASKVIQ